MWMACYSQPEIAEAVGYSRQAVREFLDSLRNRENGTDAETPVSSENPELANDAETREFDEEEDDGNKLGVYKLDKRLLIKAGRADGDLPTIRSPKNARHRCTSHKCIV